VEQQIAELKMPNAKDGDLTQRDRLCAHFFPLFLFPSTLTRLDEAENFRHSGLMKKEDKVKPHLMLSLSSAFRGLIHYLVSGR